MKYQYFYILLLQTLIIVSCSEETKETKSNYCIINNSNHKAGIILYFNGINKDYISLKKDYSSNYLFYDEAGDVHFPFFGDSLKVIFDDSVSIVHYEHEIQGASRSLLLKKSWSGGKTDDYDYEYEYKFTDADYQEALENQK